MGRNSKEGIRALLGTLDTCQDAVLDWIIHMTRKQGQCVGVSLAGQRLLDQQANAGATQ